MEKLISLAKAWLQQDPDPETVAELTALLAQLFVEDVATNNVAYQQLADRFTQFLTFGTAGLRAELGAGPNRMNRMVVGFVAAALAEFVAEEANKKYVPKVIIGYDARHNSKIFAEDSAKIFVAYGFETFLFANNVPTPLVVFGMKQYAADLAIVVTASHNPPADSGYKVYLGGKIVTGNGSGAQIVSPYDKKIEQKIVTTTEKGFHTIVLAKTAAQMVPQSLEENYIAKTVALLNPKSYPARDIKIVFTALHGVGGETMLKLFKTAGFAKVENVVEQMLPDPNFSTVKYPNPEEPGTLALAYALATEKKADLVFANDPDADRLAVALPKGDSWERLSGDQVGVLLATHLLNKNLDLVGTKKVLANSIVSSRLLEKIAQKYELNFVQTLTGFKWIARVEGLFFGYEEALGYCVAPNLVKDKDGLSAALLLAEYGAHLQQQNKNFGDVLDQLAVEHGFYLTKQLAFRVQNVGRLTEIMGFVAANCPTSFLDSLVVFSKNLLEGYNGLPPTVGFLYLCADDTRIIIRPSGTEAKLKCYLEVVAPVEGLASLFAAKQQAAQKMGQLVQQVESFLFPVGKEKFS